MNKNGNVQQWSQRMATVARSATARRSTLPLLLACIAGIITARDMLFTTGLPGGAFADSIISGTLSKSTQVVASDPVKNQPRDGELSPLEQWLRQPVEPITRNLFCTSRKPLPSSNTGGNSGDAAQVGRGAGEPDVNSHDGTKSEQKSPPSHADGQGWRDTISPVPSQGNEGTEDSPGPVRRSDRPMQARQVRLQSTLAAGAKPTALVNGQLVREGDVVAVGAGSTRAEYRVLKIETRRILLEREGIELEVTMD